MIKKNWRFWTSQNVIDKPIVLKIKIKKLLFWDSNTVPKIFLMTWNKINIYRALLFLLSSEHKYVILEKHQYQLQEHLFP